MKWSRSAKSSDTDVLEAEVADNDVVDDAAPASAAKGRPTPKRRDSQGKRGPVRAPQTRKEATARQRQLAKEERAARKNAPPRSVAEQRAAVRRGDPDALPRRDQGATRKLARDYVDAHRMLSNYLLLLFPLMIVPFISSKLAVIQIVVLALLVVFVIEWVIVGKRVRRIATERFGKADGSDLGIGFYAGSRAYMPRKWRVPAPQVERGDEI